MLAQQYLRAANKANNSLQVVESRLPQDCQTLAPCSQDYSEFSRIENTFVMDIRALQLPSSMRADVHALLDIEQRRIALAEDAAKATSLNQITGDNNALIRLGSQFEDAVNLLRLDLGLSTVPRVPPSVSASPSASA